MRLLADKMFVELEVCHFCSGMERSFLDFGWNKYTSNIVGFGVTQKTDVLWIMKWKVLSYFSDVV